MKTHSVASWLLLTASLVSTSLTPLKTFATTDATAADSATANEETSLQPIVVNSELERSGLPLGFKPGSFVQKSKDSVESQISRSLRDVISDVPGVAFLGGPRTRAQLPQIRGLGSDRVLILEDGARQNFQSGHSGRVFSDLGGFQEVEIVKGPFSSMFGSGALGGVINMRRPTARDLMNRHGRNLGGEISLDHSSADSGFGQRYTVFGVLDRDPKSFSLDPILSYSESKAIDLKLGNGKRLPHSAHTTKEFYGGLGIQTSAFGSGTTKANLKFTSYDDSGNAPLNPAEEEIPGRNPVADTKNLKTDVVLSLRHEWKHAAFELKPFMRQTKVVRVRLSDSRRDLLSIDSRGLDSFAEFETPLATRGRSVLGFDGFIVENKGERAGAVYGLFPNGETTQDGSYAQQPVV
ncbi:MAG: TonB-dependent receptor plug domain-containing protein, partial [Bdellovibrionales bacterium]|nr:TonB-dependent receptor plug domain-containing protein [Bdellovibrionales bacterium]